MNKIVKEEQKQKQKKIWCVKQKNKQRYIYIQPKTKKILSCMA